MLRGSIAISVINSTFSVEEINRHLSCNPTSVITKGQIVSNTLNKSSDKAIWLYKAKIKEKSDLSKSLKCFFQDINMIDIPKIKDSCEEIILSFYLNADEGQFGYDLSSEALSLLASLEVRVEFHILSFGLAE